MQFYAEVLKVIEGGLKGDSKKVRDYSNLLAKKLHEIGEEKKSERIEKVIKKYVGMDDDVISSASYQLPFDNESKLEIANLVMPNQIESKELFYNSNNNRQLREFISSYNESDKLAAYGLSMPFTLLMYGPPGCGKTELANFIAKELNLPIIIARLDTIISSYLGSTSKNIRMLFEYATKQPCILFLDEFDAIAKVRDDQNEQGELKRVVNSLLQNIDYLNDKSILIAATNHEALLDKAIWRRFNTRLNIDYPDKEIRKKFINHFFESIGYNYNNKYFLEILSELFNRLSIADIEQILKRSTRKSILNSKEILFSDFIEGYFEYINFEFNFMEDENLVRREKLKILLKINPDLSNRMLGEILNCHHNTVRSDLNKLNQQELEYE